MENTGTLLLSELFTGLLLTGPTVLEKYKHMLGLQQIKAVCRFPWILTHSSLCLWSMDFLACYLQTFLVLC